MPSSADPGVQWVFFPRADECPEALQAVAAVFAEHHSEIDSATNVKDNAKDSNLVLSVVSQSLLTELGWIIETGKKAKSKIRRPVLYGLNGSHEKWFDVDGWHPDLGAVLEVEAGGAVANHKFLKAIFEACVMDGVRYLVLAVPNVYYSNNNADFDDVRLWLDVAYSSGRFTLPLRGIMLIGY